MPSRWWSGRVTQRVKRFGGRHVGSFPVGLVERLTAEPPPAEVVAALMDWTSGNPFYTTELVRLIGSEHRRQRSARGDHLDAVTFYWVVHTRQGS